MSEHSHKKRKILDSVPGGWKILTLEEVAEDESPIRYGVVQIGPHVEGGVPIVPIKYINRIHESPLHKTSCEIEGKYKGSRIKSGDVLLSVKATIGLVGVVPSGFEGNIAREIARIRPAAFYDPHFIAMQLQAGETQRRISKRVVGSTRREFSIHAVRKFPIAIPESLVEQRKIAAILRTWDEAIEKLEQAIALKERMFAVTARDLLRKIAGEPSAETARLGDLVSIVKGKQLNRLDIQEGDYPVWNGGVSPSGHHNDWNTKGNTITVSEGGNSCGFVNFAKIPFWLGGHCYALTDLPSSLNLDFLFHYLKSREPEIMRLRVGSGLPNIQKGDLQRFKVVYPEKSLQEVIAATLSAGQQEIDLLAKKMNVLTAQKRGLMQKLLTGEWPVEIQQEEVVA